HVRKSITSCALAVPLMIAGSLAVAQDSGFYVGANLGESLGNISSGDLSRSLRGSGLTVSTLNSDDRDTSWKILGGYDFNRYLATELSYFDLGTYKFDALLNPSQGLTGTADMKGYGLDLVGKIDRKSVV